MLDLGWFKREVRYCLKPNGVANDRRQVAGRYKDSSDFMMDMGVWTENLSLPAVLNECLVQSYSGTIACFPIPGAWVARALKTYAQSELSLSARPTTATRSLS